MSPRLNKSRPFCYEETLRSKKKRDKSVTLLELLIAIALLSVIVIGFSSIDTFSRYHVLTADRRAQVQNEASYALEHMAKNISRAIGSVSQPPVDTLPIEGNNAIKIYIDYNNNGQRDTLDKQIAYRYRPASIYEIWYYPNYTDNSANYEVLTGRNPTTNYSFIMPDFSNNTSQPTYVTYSSGNNYIETQITARWNPAQATSSDNPSVTMRTRIKMPSVSTH